MLFLSTKQFLPLSCLPLYESSSSNFDGRFWNLTMIILCYVLRCLPCCRVLGIFMRTSPIVGGNGNTLKKRQTKPRSPLFETHICHCPDTSLFLITDCLSVAKLKGTSQVSIFRVLPMGAPGVFRNPSDLILTGGNLLKYTVKLIQKAHKYMVL